jgi:hypothetical protein
MRRAATVLLTAFLISSCGGGAGNSTPTTPTPSPTVTPTVTSLDVTGDGCTGGVCPGQVGATLQLRATAQLSNSTTQDVTSLAQWNSTNTNVASVNSSGVVTFRSSGDADVTAGYQGKLAGQTMRPSGFRTVFGAGQYLIGKDIAAARYFTDPTSSCYWERESGLGGTLAEVIANDFVSFDAGQIVVDVKSSDLAFKTESSCGTWSQTPKAAPQSGIPPGVWLVNSQIPPGTYRTTASSGCYWERDRNFEGTLSSIIANDFASSAGQQLVTISASDVGFHTDSSCGTWTRASLTSSLSDSPPVDATPASIEANWRAHRASR